MSNYSLLVNMLLTTQQVIGSSITMPIIINHDSDAIFYVFRHLYCKKLFYFTLLPITNAPRSSIGCFPSRIAIITLFYHSIMHQNFCSLLYLDTIWRLFLQLQKYLPDKHVVSNIFCKKMQLLC